MVVLCVDAGATNRPELLKFRSTYFETDLDTGRCRDLAEFCRPSSNDAMPAEMLPPKSIAGASVSNMAAITEANRSYSLEGRLSSGPNLDFGVSDAGPRSTLRQTPDRYPQTMSPGDNSSPENDRSRHRRSDETGLGERGRSDSSQFEARNTDRSSNRNQYPLANSSNEVMRSGRNDGGQVRNPGGMRGLHTVDAGDMRVATSAAGGMPMNTLKSAAVGWTPSHGTFSLRPGSAVAASAAGYSLVRDRDAGVADIRRPNDRSFSAQVKRQFFAFHPFASIISGVYNFL
jgi:hypothetical protein